MKQNLITGLLLSTCLCTITLLEQYIDEDTLKCIRQAGYLDQTFINGQYQYSSDKINFRPDPQLIVRVLQNKPFVVIYLYQLIYDNSPDLEALRYAKMLQDVPAKMFFIANMVRQMNCSYLSSFVNTLQKNLKVPLGIASNSLQWSFIFGSSTACSKQFVGYPLYWNGHSGTEPKYEAFGSWSTCDLKNLYASERFKCGTQITEIVVCGKKTDVEENII